MSVKVFHIGIPKSGTTTVQKTLANDPRIQLTRTGKFTDASWWYTNVNEKAIGNKMVVESNETLVSGGFSKVKLNTVISRLHETNPYANIVLTIRNQEKAILSMFRYHIKYHFKGTRSLKNWMFNTNLGMDYLSCCLYGDVVKTILQYFPKSQIQVIPFEMLKDHPNSFYKEYYQAIGVEFDEKHISPPQNSGNKNDQSLYTLAKWDRLSFFRKTSENSSFYLKLSRLERIFQNTFAKLSLRKVPDTFFSFKDVDGSEKLEEDFKRSNQYLIDMGFVDEVQLKKWGYIC